MVANSLIFYFYLLLSLTRLKLQYILDQQFSNFSMDQNYIKDLLKEISGP